MWDILIYNRYIGIKVYSQKYNRNNSYITLIYLFLNIRMYLLKIKKCHREYVVLEANNTLLFSNYFRKINLDPHE